MAEITLDEVDFELLKRLDRDGDIDADEVSSELDISPSTVYYRLEKYRDQGILKGYVAEIDAGQIGLGLTAITRIKSSYGQGFEEIAEDLASLSGVQKVYFMLGEMSFYVISRIRDHEHLQSLLEKVIKMEGVENSVTNVVLRTFKDESRLLVNYDEDDLDKLFR